MNRFTERQGKIIEQLASCDQYMTGKALSITLGLSLRTIQSEVASINRVLPLIHSSNKGYHVDQNVYLLLERQTAKVYENDVHAVLRKLIFSDEDLQVDNLADHLYMSSTTLENRLRDAQPVLEQFQLKLLRKNTRIRIDGSESDKRKLIKYLIFQEVTPAFNSVLNLENYFPGIDMEKIRSIILNAIDKYDYHMESAYYNNVIVNIAIALYRMRSDYYVADASSLSEHTGSTEYRIASEICLQYAAHCHITPTVYDVSYISRFLEGQLHPNHQEEETSVSPEILTKEFTMQISQILDEVFGYYLLDIDYGDYLYGFALHVNEMIRRAKNAQSAQNEILQNLKKSCPFIYDVAVSVARRLEEIYHVEIADSEIGYISIHIGYLIETATQKTDKISVLLLCSGYHHIADTLERNLRENFSSLMDLTVLHTDQIQQIDNLPSADLILTTLSGGVPGRQTLEISPFYTGTDHVRIDHALHACLDKKKKRQTSNLLSTFFHRDLFFKQDDFSSKEEVIRFLGRKAIDFGLVGEDFIDSVLKREHMSSTCFFDTFAIPHGIEMDATRTMVCVLISDRGIPWDTHKIHIVLMITVHPQDRKKFMGLYEGIVLTLENPEKVKRLVESENYDEFIPRFIALGPEL